MVIDPRTHFIIPKDLSEDILEFTNDKMFHELAIKSRAGERNQYKKNFVNFNRTTLPLKQRVQTFASECYGFWNIDVKREHFFGNFVSVTEQGNSLHKHKDPRSPEGDWHVRLNFIIQKPDSGGTPELTIDTDKKSLFNELNIEEGHSWINFASEWWHGSTEVVGQRKRIILSLGNYVKADVAQKLLESFYRD